MKYFLYDIDTVIWKGIYCKKEDPNESTMQNVAKVIGLSFEKFDKTKSTCANGKGIVSDENIFIVDDMDGMRYIWQLGSQVADMMGTLIPHYYHVRKIGVICL